MVTWRCRSILLLSGLGFFTGMVFYQEWIALCALSVLTWIGINWLRFKRVASGSSTALVQVRRIVQGSNGDQHVMIAGTIHDIELIISFSPRLARYHVQIADIVSTECGVVGPNPSYEFGLNSQFEFRKSYSICPEIQGKTSLPGFSMVVADDLGFFKQRYVVGQTTELTILPSVLRSQSTVSTIKKQNLLLFAGHHRYRKPGLGTEILGIRDYQPGDPPRSIAWKASARFNRLMTCEYESEAPVKCNLIADLSSFQFLGRPAPSPADRVISACASVANLLIADRDPVSCTMISEDHFSVVKSGVGQRQLTRIIEGLISFKSSSSIPLIRDVANSIQLIWHNCNLRFPELFAPDVNRFKERSAWLKVFGWGNRDAVTRGKRRQLSFAFCVLFDLEPGAVARLMNDDDYFLRTCSRYEMSFPLSTRLPHSYADQQQIRKLQQKTTERLSKLLLERAKHANDNELFVVVTAPPGNRRDEELIQETIKVLLGNHHRVMLLLTVPNPESTYWHDPLAENIALELAGNVQAKDVARFRMNVARYGCKTALMDSATLDQKIAGELELLKFGRQRVGQ